MRKIRINKLFPVVSEELKKEFRKEILYSNIWKSRLFGIILIFIHLIFLTIDYFNYKNELWNKVPGYKYLFIMHLVLVSTLCIYLIITKSATRKIQTNKIFAKHYVFEYGYILFILFWCSVVSIVDQYIHQEITVFILGCIIVAVIFIQNLRQSLINYLSCYLLFSVGMYFFQTDPHKFQGFIINSASLLILSLIISRIFYNYSVRQFINKKKLEDAIHEKENNEYNLQLININLDRVIKERTKALSDTNAKLFNEITKRLQIEEALKANENKYRLLTELSKDLIWTMDLNMKYTFISPSVKKLRGFMPEEFLALPLDKIFLPESLERAKKVFAFEVQKALREGISDKEFSYIIELQHYNKDGSISWGEVNTSAICDEEGKLVGIHGITRDITDRKKTEEALRNSEEKYRLITDNINDLVWCMDLNLNSTFTSPSIVKVLGITLEERKDILTSDILTPDSYQNVVKVLSETIGKIKRGEIKDKNYNVKMELEQVKKDGTVFWAETVVSALYDKNDNVIGIQGVTRDINTRVIAEKTLKESEENFRILFENSPLGILVCSSKGEILRINPTLIKILGSPSAEATKKINLLTFKPLVDAGLSELLSEAIITNNEIVAERKYISKWEKELFILTHIKPINDVNGHLLNIQVIVQDITERKTIEQALRNSEEMYRLVVETANDVIYTVSLDSTLTTVNSAFQKNTGWTPKEVIGKSSLFFMHPEDVDRSRKNHFEFLKNPLSETTEFRFLHKNGNYLNVEFSTAPLFKDGKLIGRFGIGRNITERKLAEDALRESEEKYRNLIENQGEGVGIVNTNEEFIFANPAADEIYGVAKGALVGRNLKEFVEPKQYLFIQQQTNLRKNGLKSSYEITITRPNKEQRNLLLTATPFYEKGDEVMSIFGIFRDITSRKMAEEALRKSEEKYRVIFENAKEGIFQSTMEGRFITVNPSMAKMYGYSTPDELITACTDIASQTYVKPELRQEFIKIMKEVGYVKGFEYEVYKKDRSRMWIYEDANAVKDKKGNILYFDGFLVDISGRKKEEEAKKKQYDFIELSSQISSEFIKLDTSEINDSIVKALEIVVNYTQISRGYVYLFTDNKEKLKHTCEWNNKGSIAIKKKLNCIDMLYANNSVSFLNEIGEACFINEESEKSKGSFNELMISTGALSYILLPLFISNKLIGYIGFDSTVKKIKWTPEITNAFNLTGQLITHALVRKQKDEQIKASLNEKEILLKEIHHRVKNNMQVIICLLNLQANTINNIEIKDIFEESQDRIKAMAIIHEKLYQSKNFSEIDFAGYIKNLTDYLLHSYNITGKNVIIETDADSIPVEIDMAVPLGLIINELVTNAFKYAFKKNAQGKIFVGLHLNKKEELVLEVSDNGCGLPDNIDYQNTSSLGLQLVCSLTQQIEGVIELNKENGTTFKITFPYKKNIKN